MFDRLPPDRTKKIIILKDLKVEKKKINLVYKNNKHMHGGIQKKNKIKECITRTFPKEK